MRKILANMIVGILIMQLLSFFIAPISGEKIEINENNEFEEYIPDEIIVKFKAGITNDKISSIISKHDMKVEYKSRFTHFYRIKIPEGKSVSEMIEIYQNNPFVEYAEPNYIAHACMNPNDPYFSYQWHLQGSDQGGIDMTSAWDISTGNGAVVAVLDTGISTAGQDLTQTCILPGYDFINNDNNPTDDNGHGTHVAGTIAQSTNNGVGVCGVAFDACLMPVKILDSGGSGTYAQIVDGIYYAVDNGANIISMSLTGPVGTTALENACAYAYNNGVTMVAASGNDYASNVGYPAAYDAYVIAVGATRYDKTRAAYSNYGTSLDLVAPGGDLSVDQNGDGYGDGVLQETFSPDWSYWFFDGTSMATPHVSGTAALLYSKGVTTPDNIREALQNTAIDLGATGWDIYYGHGLINAFNALQYNQGDNPPTCTITSPANGATVSGEVTIQVTATDDVGVTKVDFYVDSGYLGSDYTAPYSWIWDSTLVNDDTHTITATAYDTISQTKSDSINIFVDNINEPPVADAGPDQNAYVDDIVEFDGSSSTDDGSIVTYEWDFGDGSPKAYGITVTHAYSSVDIYTVTLTVTDNGGLTDSDQAIVTIEEAPLETVEFIDSFEVGEWNGLWVEDSQNDWFRSTQRATDGSYSAEVDGSASDATLTMVNEIDLSGKSGATLTFSWFIERSWDSGEYIALDAYNGGWTEVKRLSGNVDVENTWHHETIDLGSYLLNGFKIRFRAKVSSSFEDGNVDNVKIVSFGGQPNNPPNTPTNPVPANGATGVNLNPTLNVDVSDPDGEAMDVTFYDASDNSIIGTDINVPSGGTASTTWSDLSYETIYSWYAIADDGKDQTTSPDWSFTTGEAPPNNAPDAPSSPVPSNGETDVGLSPILSVYVNDIDGDTMTVNFYAQGGSLIGTDTVSGSGTATTIWSSADEYLTTYYWYAVADDGIDQTTSTTWTFTTEEEPLETVEFYDSFENGQWDGKWVEDSQNDWFTSTQRQTDGLYSAEVDGRATDATLTMIDSIDLSDKTGAILTFDWLIERGFDRGEYIALDIYDGGWTEIKRLSGNVDVENVWHYETIDLTSYMNSDFKIRFRARASQSNEDGNVDNIKIISY